MATMFAFVIALVARKPFKVDTVFACKMLFQISTGLAFELTLGARKPFNVDIVLLGKMLF